MSTAGPSWRAGLTDPPLRVPSRVITSATDSPMAYGSRREKRVWAMRNPTTRTMAAMPPVSARKTAEGRQAGAVLIAA